MSAQPSLFAGVVTRARKPGHLPASSIAAYQERSRDERVRIAVELVTRYPRHTSAELAAKHYGGHPDTDQKLYLRRGLSDAQKLGLVEHGLSLVPCAVTGRPCVTWIVKGR